MRVPCCKKKRIGAQIRTDGEIPKSVCRCFEEERGSETVRFQAHGEIVQEWKAVGAGMEGNGGG